MAKHNFGLEVTVPIAGFQCTKCGKIVPSEDGKPPKKSVAEECQKEDCSQAAARIVREATEG
jgi:hypothetical protein